jgi:hypothetical protein
VGSGDGQGAGSTKSGRITLPLIAALANAPAREEPGRSGGARRRPANGCGRGRTFIDLKGVITAERAAQHARQAQDIFHGRSMPMPAPRPRRRSITVRRLMPPRHQPRGARTDRRDRQDDPAARKPPAERRRRAAAELTEQEGGGSVLT